MEIKKILESLGINPQNSGAAIGGNWLHTNSEIISSFSPVDGKKIGEVSTANEKNYNDCIAFIQNIFNEREVSISQSKNLSNLVLDIYFTCYLEDFNFMRKKIYSLNKKADLLMQRVKYRKKKLIACDMDMTIINVETIDLINDNLLKNNQISNITKNAMSGNMSFGKSIIIRTKLLKGIKKLEIINLINKININEGVESVIRTMNSFGHHTILISGGYDLIANSIGQKVGFKEIRCNTLEFANNHLTGNLVNTILDKKGKLFHISNKTYIEEMLRSYQDQHGTIKKENIPITVKMHPELDESDF